MEIARYLIHAANGLFLGSYVMRDILWLRVLTVAATGCLIPYNAVFLEDPTPAIAWASLFIGINVVQIWLLFLERRPVRWGADEQKLYQLAFRSLRPREFLTLLRLAEWKQAQSKECMARRGDKLERMMVVFDGSVAVWVGDRRVATLKAGQFIGEMSFLTGQVPTADVTAEEPTRYVSWPMDPLKAFLRKHPELRSALQMIIGADLVTKLRAQ